jgi:hypothetical protein
MSLANRPNPRRPIGARVSSRARDGRGPHDRKVRTMSKASSTTRGAKKPARTKSKAKRKASTKTGRRPRTDSKQAQLIAMLKRPGGTTIDEIVKALDWQPHTVRGAIAGALKKKLGLKVESEKVDPEHGRVYRIAQ